MHLTQRTHNESQLADYHHAGHLVILCVRMWVEWCAPGTCARVCVGGGGGWGWGVGWDVGRGGQLYSQRHAPSMASLSSVCGHVSWCARGYVCVCVGGVHSSQGLKVQLVLGASCVCAGVLDVGWCVHGHMYAGVLTEGVLGYMNAH